MRTVTAATAALLALLAAPAHAATRPTVSKEDLAQVGRLMIISIPGKTLDPTTRFMISREKLGGVVLFGRNVGTDAQLKTLDSGMHAAAGKRGFLVTTDQEGGTVRRIASAQPVISAAAAGRLSPGRIEQLMTTAGRQLRALGIDVDLAPDSDRAGGFLGTRSYGSRPGAAVSAAVRGLQAPGGVIATAKHFPGLGGLPTSTDDATVTAPQVSGGALAPFADAVGAHVGLLMVDLAVHPDLGTQPAALEKSTYSLLRGPKVRYQGPVITDALDAKAVAHYGEAQAAVKAVEAGADLVCVPGGPVIDQEVIAALQRALRSGELPVKRFEEALRAAEKIEAPPGLAGG